jgi:glutamate synthase domain-containing protein 2
MFWTILAVFVALLALVAIYDLLQKKRAILRNFPVVGHLRYILERFGPELRQYIVTDNDEERPFSRSERRWVYSSAKEQTNLFGFGSSADIEHSSSYLIVKHAAFPKPDNNGSTGSAPDWAVPSAKVLGAARGRTHALRVPSVVNISSMSFGSLSAAAVEALNKGAERAGAWHGSGEGGLSPHHKHGGDLTWQIGTGYFGCRTPDGKFDLSMLKDKVAEFPVKALEIKLSQGAKPGLGGMLPGSKVTEEIAAIRGVPVGKDVKSPNSHSAFGSVDEMLDWVEMLAQETGIPVGIKSAVGEKQFWIDLADAMVSGERGVDFVTIDGGEGGTGAAPLVFADHVALPFNMGFPRVFTSFAERGISGRTFFFASGRLGLPERAMTAFALGADAVNVAREPLLAVGCIQAQKCHTGHCPTGVATQSKRLQRALDPESKGDRVANYLRALRKEVIQLSRACGVDHPSLLAANQIEFIDNAVSGKTLRETFHYQNGWEHPDAEDMAAIARLMTKL